MFEAYNTRNGKKNTIHIVIICDETGIFDAFKTIKNNLGNRHEAFLSLIYSVPEEHINPLFEKEIKILEKRYSHNLYTYTLRIEPGEYDLVQEFIEAIINSNTMLEMQFLIFGTEEFADYISGVLKYLNIETYSFISKIINQ